MASKRPDEDSPEWTTSHFASARPASEVHGPTVAAKLVRKGGRPVLPQDMRKQATSIRLSPDVLEALRATGANWQTRADEALRTAFVGRR